jgi:hypothetical protein
MAKNKLILKPDADQVEKFFNMAQIAIEDLAGRFPMLEVLSDVDNRGKFPVISFRVKAAAPEKKNPRLRLAPPTKGD